MRNLLLSATLILARIARLGGAHNGKSRHWEAGEAAKSSYLPPHAALANQDYRARETWRNTPAISEAVFYQYRSLVAA